MIRSPPNMSSHQVVDIRYFFSQLVVIDNNHMERINMRHSMALLIAVLAISSLYVPSAARAQYAPFSIGSNATTLDGNSSETTVAAPSWSCSISSMTSPSSPANANCVVTTTEVWYWAGGGAPQNPYTLYGHGDMNGSQGGIMGGSGTASCVVDGNACFNFHRAASTTPGVGSFGPNSNPGTFHPDVNGFITAYIIGETHTSATLNGFASASTLLYIRN